MKILYEDSLPKEDREIIVYADFKIAELKYTKMLTIATKDLRTAIKGEVPKDTILNVDSIAYVLFITAEDPNWLKDSIKKLQRPVRSIDLLLATAYTFHRPELFSAVIASGNVLNYSSDFLLPFLSNFMKSGDSFVIKLDAMKKIGNDKFINTIVTDLFLGFRGIDYIIDNGQLVFLDAGGPDETATEF